jgi:hypothetical protein
MLMYKATAGLSRFRRFCFAAYQHKNIEKQ